MRVAATTTRARRPTRQRPRGRAAWLALALIALAGLYVAATAAQVWWAATSDEARDADAVVVLGAAQYDGRPSQALKGRLDHARSLFEQGYAPQIVVTGGRREGDRFTEAAAGAAYLEATGVPGSAIERETTGGTSYASLSATARFLRDDGIERVLLVSDPFHNYRITQIAEEVGLEAHPSASTTSPFRGIAELRQMGRETVAVALGRVIGYRRLDDIGLRLDGVRAAR